MERERFCGRCAGYQVCKRYLYESVLDNVGSEKSLDRTFCGLSDRNATRRYEPKELTQRRDVSVRVVEAGVKVGSSRASEQGIFSEISGDKLRSVISSLDTEEIRGLVSSSREAVCTLIASGTSGAELLLRCPSSLPP